MKEIIRAWQQRHVHLTKQMLLGVYAGRTGSLLQRTEETGSNVRTAGIGHTIIKLKNQLEQSVAEKYRGSGTKSVHG